MSVQTAAPLREKIGRANRVANRQHYRVAQPLNLVQRGVEPLGIAAMGDAITDAAINLLDRSEYVAEA